jgi:cbb3-type cytochrome oxidase subunit 1
MMGGVLFLTGALIMVYNFIQTVRSPETAPRAVVPPLPVGLAVAGE